MIAARDGAGAFLKLPRYEPFTGAVVGAATVSPEISFEEIAGNRVIAVTVLAPPGWRAGGDGSGELFRYPLLEDQSRERIAFSVPVNDLVPIVAGLGANGAVAAHVFDY